MRRKWTKMRTIIALALFSIGVSSESQNVCEDPFSTVYLAKCFRYFSDKLRWRDAQAACMTWGGNLASITSQSEASFISEVTNTPLNSGFAWIGLNYRGRDHQDWAWDDGTKYSPEKYTNWKLGQPDSTRPRESGCCQECVMIETQIADPTEQGKWYDNHCKFCNQSTI